jgi:hypothetical protein
MVWSPRMRSDLLAAPRLVCAAALLLFSCTRTLDFDDLSSESVPDDTNVTGIPDADAGSAKPTDTSDETAMRDAGGGGLDGGFSCRNQTPAPAFCDDFDTLPLVNLWDEIILAPEDGGTLAHDGDEALSPTNSLLATVRPGIAAGTYVGLVARKSFSEVGQRPSRIDIDFDMKIEQFDPAPGSNIVAFQFLLGALVPASLRNQLVLDVHSNGAQVRTRFNENLLNEDGLATMSETHELRSGPPVNRWSHVSFQIDVDEPSGSNNHARIRIGPRETFENEAVTLFHGKLRYVLHEGRPQMEVGIPWVNTAGETAAWRIRYDNVLVRLGFK